MSVLSILDITVDERCQPRVAVDPNIVSDYADEMVGGADFPPLTVYFDGSIYWLADGFHRLSAAIKLGLAEVDCDVRQGQVRDAILHSVGANANHGLRRTNADKQRAINTLLSDPDWSKWSDREIADRCGVSNTTVSTRRSSLSKFDSERTYITKHGTVSTMNTANIGIVYQCERCGQPHRGLHVCPQHEVHSEHDIEPDKSTWWDDNPKTPPPPPSTQTHSTTWIQPERRTWEQDDAKAFAALLALQDASSREARFVAAAAVETNPVGARLMMQRSAELLIWHRAFLTALKDQLT